MKAGQLNRRIVIQRQTDERDEIGEQIDAWTEFAKVWANILRPTGSMTIKADAPTSISKASIRIRYRADLNAGMRVLHGTTTYKIEAILPDEVDRDYLFLVCEVINA